MAKFSLRNTRQILGTRCLTALIIALVAVLGLAFIGLVQNFKPIATLGVAAGLAYAVAKGAILAWRAHQFQKYAQRAKTTVPDFLMTVLLSYEAGTNFPIPVQKVYNPADILSRLEVDSTTPIIRVRLPLTKRWTAEEAEFQAAIALDALRTKAALYSREKGLEALRKGKHPYIYIDSVQVIGINLQLEILLTDSAEALKFLQNKEQPAETKSVELTDEDFI